MKTNSKTIIHNSLSCFVGLAVGYFAFTITGEREVSEINTPVVLVNTPLISEGSAQQSCSVHLTAALASKPGDQELKIVTVNNVAGVAFSHEDFYCVAEATVKKQETSGEWSQSTEDYFYMLKQPRRLEVIMSDKDEVELHFARYKSQFER